MADNDKAFKIKFFESMIKVREETAQEHLNTYRACIEDIQVFRLSLAKAKRETKIFEFE